MSADPLEEVLRLVADGKLTAEEAAPILAALDDRGPRPEPAAAAPTDEAPGRDRAGRSGARTLRIEVKDQGRPVINLRLPVALGKLALDRVPGLSGEQASRVRDALNSGYLGSLLEVDDDGDGVRIILE